MSSLRIDMSQTSSKEAYFQIGKEAPETVELFAGQQGAAYDLVGIVQMLTNKDVAPHTPQRPGKWASYRPDSVQWVPSGEGGASLKVVLSPGFVEMVPHRPEDVDWDLNTFRSDRVVRKIKDHQPQSFTLTGARPEANKGLVGAVLWAIGRGGYRVTDTRWSHDPHEGAVRMDVALEQGGGDE